jgi:hypothetical protein
MKSLSFWMILSALFCLMIGCGAADHQRLLNKRIYGYNQQLRWSLMDTAQSFVDSKYLEDWQRSHLKSRKDVKLTAIESKLISVSQTQPPVAEFKTRISWYIEGEMSVRHSEWRQTWRFEKNQWLIISEKNLSGDQNVWP